MNAKEAYKISTENIDVLPDKELNLIIQRIEDASKSGLFFTPYESLNYTINIHKLEKMGYEVESNINPEFPSLVLISWQNPKSQILC